MSYKKKLKPVTVSVATKIPKEKDEKRRVYVASGNFTCWVDVVSINNTLEDDDAFLFEGATKVFEILFGGRKSDNGFMLTAINYETVDGISIETENFCMEDVGFADFIQLAFEDDRDDENKWKFISVHKVLENAGLAMRKFDFSGSDDDLEDDGLTF